jgi:hypothetical protein
MAYTALVRSNLEYCSTVWSPHTKKQKSEIEKIQRRAARYTTGRFHITSSVTSMLDHLEWNSLETRRNIAKVTMLCEITHNQVAINPDFYISSQTSLTRHSHSLRYKPFSTSTNYFKFSFFPHTVVLWNALPPDIVSASSLDRFKSQIQTVFHFIYSKTSLNRTMLALNHLFSLDRCLVYTGSNYRHSVDGTIKSVWIRQVFGLLRVQ